MTGDELERAIQRIISLQSRLEVQFEMTNQQLARTDERIKMTDEQLARTEQQVGRTSRQEEEPCRWLESYIETQKQCIEIISRHVEEQRELNASLRASLAHTDKRLDALIDIVREERNG